MAALRSLGWGTRGNRLESAAAVADHPIDIHSGKVCGAIDMIGGTAAGCAGRNWALADAAKMKNVFAITGKADRTVCAVRDDHTVLYTSAGDGLVTSEASHIEGVPTWQVNAPHGMLGRHELLIESLLELLAGVSTSKLPRASTAAPIADAAPVSMEEPLFFQPKTICWTRLWEAGRHRSLTSWNIRSGCGCHTAICGKPGFQ